MSLVECFIDPDEQVVIKKDVYKDLLIDQKFLQCLEAAGVDNWEGYSVAQEMFNE